MSLLIKALDQAAKNKEAEQGLPAAKNAPLNLSLEPLTEKPVAAIIDKEHVEKVMPTEATLAQQSLEEEAGLSLSPKKTVRSKYAKNEAPLASAPIENAELVTAKSFNLNADNTTTIDADDVPIQATILPPVFQSMAQEQQKQEAQKQNQQTAAKVFVANQQSKKANSTLGLFLLALAGALILLLLWQGYQMLRTLFAPEPLQVSVTAPAPTTESLAGLNAELNQSQSQDVLDVDTATLNAQNQSADNTQASISVDTSTKAAAVIDNQMIDMSQSNKISPTEEALIKPSAIEQDMRNIRAVLSPKTDTEKVLNADTSLSAGDIHTNEPVRQNSQTRQTGRNQSSVQLLKKTPADSVDPRLQIAYQAFTVGDFALAQQQYRTVLQADIRNVDALLGMAAIAQRQNRLADANGWYQKVLEIEPRNTTAQTAMANILVNDDAVATESRLKSMIAEQPNNANLHATLGNVFAEKNQWTSAQEAYFNASKLAPDNADYAFNLAVSLEQLRKPKLAYVQYLRALDLRNANNANSPDKAVLEARIKALSAQ